MCLEQGDQTWPRSLTAGVPRGQRAWLWPPSWVASSGGIVQPPAGVGNFPGRSTDSGWASPPHPRSQPHLHPSASLESPGLLWGERAGGGRGGLTAHPADRANPQPTPLEPWLPPGPGSCGPPTCLLWARRTQASLRSHFPPLCKIHPLPGSKLCG